MRRVAAISGSRRRLGPLLLWGAAAAAFVAVGPLLDAAGQSYWVVALTRAALLCVLAVSTDLAWGVTGIFALGQAVFFGIGAYAAGLLSVNAEIVDLPLLAGAALGIGLVAGVVVGAFLFFGRRRVGELYVGLVTLALTYALERLASGWSEVGAGNGIPGLPLPVLGGTEIAQGLDFFLLAALVLVVVFGICVAISRSQLGLVMRAIRDDDERAEFLGYRRPLVQLVVFAIAAAFSALAGCLYALEEGFVSPSLLGVALSTQVLVFILFGGRGTLVGPVVGVLVIEVGGQRVQESLPSEWPIVVSGLLLLTIMYLPRGLVDLPRRLRELRDGRRGAGPVRPEASHARP